MAIDLGNKESLDRLNRAIKTSRYSMVPFQRVRSYLVEDFVGSWYSPYGAKLTTLINKLNQSARIMQMAMAANDPQVKVTTFRQEMMPFARRFQESINRVVKNIDLKTTLQMCLLDSFFLIGMAQVRLADSNYVEIEDNVWVNPGQAWVDRISFDNAIFDMAVNDIRAMRFYGHQYRASWRRCNDRDDFDKKVLDKMTPTNKQQSDNSANTAGRITSGWSVDDDEIEPMVWLRDVFLPENQQWVTFSGDNPELGPLKILDWDGHPQGPYRFLALGMVPDNIMPSSPAQQLKPLHDLMNILYRKLSQQAANQKRITLYKPGAEKDADQIRRSKDGDYLQVRSPKDDVYQADWNGVDGNTHLFFQAASEVYNTQSGNERSVAGLAEEAHTVGQESQIAAHAGGLIGQMKSQFYMFGGELCREVGSIMWDSETLSVDSTMQLDGMPYRAETNWRPNQREGLKDYYTFNVSPNSMTFTTPEMKLQKVFGFLERITPVMPMIQAGLVDIVELAKLGAEYMDVPEIIRVFRPAQEPGPQMSGMNGATKAPVTQRTVNRSTGGGGPGAGAAQQMSMARPAGAGA